MCVEILKAQGQNICNNNVLLLLFCFFFFIHCGSAQTDSLTHYFMPQDSGDLSLSLPAVYHQAVAIETIPSGRLQQLSTAPLAHIIQGQAVGVWSMQSSAQPAGLSSLWVRGYNSSVANNQPFVILDGVPLYHNEPFIAVAQIDPLSLLNPFDIASVEIIKDGSAARYGIRGFNGVLLINTRHGQKGKPQIHYHGSVGLQQPSKVLALLDAQQYAGYINEFYQRQDSVVFSEEQIHSLGKGTDWQKELYSLATVWQHHLSASGGAKKTQYYLSGSYLNQQGIVKNSSFTRYTVSGNLTHQLTSRLSITPQIHYVHLTSQLTPAEVINDVLSFSPTVPVKDSLGNYHANGPIGYGFEANPMEQVDRIKNQYESSQLFSKVTMGFQIIDSLFLSLNLGRNSSDGKYFFRPEKDYQRWTEEQQFQRTTYIIEPTLSYHRLMAKHEIGATIGYAYQEEKQEVDMTQRDNFEDRITRSYNSQSEITYTTPLWADLSYQYDKRYVVMLTGRFENYMHSINNKVFSPAVALAWHVHQESFAQRWNQTACTFRVSYGSIKKDYPVYITSRRDWITNSEKHQQWNAGMDLSLFHSRVNFSVDAFQKNLDNILTSSLPSSTGYGGTSMDMMANQNRGLEFTLATHLKGRHWVWNSSVNLTTISTQVTKIPDQLKYYVSSTSLPSIGFITDEGTPVGSFYGYTTDGLFTGEDEVEASQQWNAELGGLKFLDVSGGKGRPDGILDLSDATAIGHAQPKWQAGMQQYVGYHRWSVEASLYASVGNEVLHYQKYLQQSGFPYRNQYERILQRWSPERPESTIPAHLSASAKSDYAVENASFLRLRHIMLGYQFPLLKNHNAKLYLSAQNLFTLTAYQGYDPEVSHFGQNVNALGVDYDSYPRAKTFLVGCHLNF